MTPCRFELSGRITAIVATYFNRPDPPKGPTPRLANGKPDLTGVRLGRPTDLGGLDLQEFVCNENNKDAVQRVGK